MGTGMEHKKGPDNEKRGIQNLQDVGGGGSRNRKGTSPNQKKHHLGERHAKNDNAKECHKEEVPAIRWMDSPNQTSQKTTCWLFVGEQGNRDSEAGGKERKAANKTSATGKEIFRNLGWVPCGLGYPPLLKKKQNVLEPSKNDRYQRNGVAGRDSGGGKRQWFTTQEKEHAHD